nr:ABC transporter ATP-binding protein [Cyanobium sp. Morenito 9A2]
MRNLWHRYPRAVSHVATGAEWTLSAVDFQLNPGELVGLLGPSGCGKSTLLRLIAGFERPSRGSVWIDGREVAGPRRWIEPERRGVGMVFQDYALFPHLDAWRNTCFGLRPHQERGRAAWLLELLGLKGLEQRYPHELSGGQRQRLALARALAPGPALVLLDEPFSNLDVEVRTRLRGELPGVLGQCGASGLIVTHDPEEALAICDRVAVLRAGVLHQCASPRELVEHPASAFVGRFALQGNLLPAWRERDRIHTAVGVFAPQGEVPRPQDARPDTGRGEPLALEVLIRPSGFDLAADPAGEVQVVGREFLGREWFYQVEAGPLRLRLRLPLEQELERGQRCRLSLKPDQWALLFPEGVSLLPIPGSVPML